MVKWSWRNDGFEGKKRRGRPKVLNKESKILLKKARYKMGDLTSKLSHSWQAKSTTGYEKRMFKIIRGPWDGQKNLCLVCQVTHSSSQICKEEQKPCCGRGQGWLSFFDECPEYFFFQLPKLNKLILFGGCTGSHTPIDKKAQNGSSERLQTKRACQLLKFWIHVLNRQINIF